MTMKPIKFHPGRETHSHRSVLLVVGADTWRMDVLSVMRQHDNWFVDVVLVGPPTYTFSVCTAGPGPTIAARGVISYVREWLRENAERGEVR